MDKELTKGSFHKILDAASQPIKSASKKTRTSAARQVGGCSEKRIHSRKTVDT
jgi:hypothetical protein